MTQGSDAPDTLLSAKGIRECADTAHEQMPAIGDLDGLGGTLARPVGVGAGAIAAEDLDAGVVLQPGGEGLSGPVGQEIDGDTPLLVHQERAVGAATLAGSVVHAEHTRRRRFRERQGAHKP